MKIEPTRKRGGGNARRAERDNVAGSLGHPSFDARVQFTDGGAEVHSDPSILHRTNER